MDIHRSRFVPYPSSAINALAFSYAEPEHGNQDPESLRLAIGRANGNVEIWNPKNGAWLQEKVFYGGKDRSVEGLAWTQEPDTKNAHGKGIPGRLRLFSIGYSSSVTEWDLASGLPLRHSNGNHSEVWCFAVQPRNKRAIAGNPIDPPSAHQKIVAGCADGTIVLLSTEDQNLTFDRFVSRATNKKARALSITYKDSDIVLAGFADSMIRVFDTRNGNVLRNISLGSGPHGGPREILVWKVRCLANGDFVSGDSTGDIRIYNGKNYSQMQRISGHEADILDLAVSRDGKNIFSAGMDRRTCFYTCRKPTTKIEGHSGKWRKVSHQRYHQHDVKAMSAYDGHKLNVVVSGGIDTQPVIVPLSKFGQELSRGLPSLPPSPPLISAPDARLLVSWWNTELRVWRVKPQDDGGERPKVVARLALQGEENITSASITSDGMLLAVATTSTVKLFQLLQPQSRAVSSLRIRKLEMPSISGARIVRLSATGKWLSAMDADNDIQLVRIVRTDDAADLPRALNTTQHLHRLSRDNVKHTQLDGSTEGYARTIAHSEFSTDGNVFAVVDLAGFVDTWVTEGHEDSTAPEVDIDDAAPMETNDDDSDDEEKHTQAHITFLGQHWIRNPSGHLIPRLDSTPVLLSFQPNHEELAHLEPNGNPAVHPTRHNPHPHAHDLPTMNYRLLLVSADHQLYLFDVMSGGLSDWSKRNPPSSYPHEYLQLDLPAKGCIWDVKNSQHRIWLYGEKWLFMFDLTRDLSISESSRKRKWNGHKDNSGAGDSISHSERSITKMRKFDGKQNSETGWAKWTDIDPANSGDDAAEDEVMDDVQLLANLRRSNTEAGQANGRLPKVDGTEEAISKQQQSETWWHTFKYRPILGILPVGENASDVPEVVLVERPSWDLDLPPRFVGAHEQ
ncbi:small nucleolar ribonucleo protein-like protein complex subunit [Setomelanomma holmii]|uniref:Small nucleolar ribonucleo protein-like protein complex subunit n=1 Tax=Setomelanomma holmii TaxID=210430 RepID=A0A9P4H8Z0_9PLEO|nr:small nucleolar ribonucleo protein-like protein complex subunit [Setomelanomma holmii]